MPAREESQTSLTLLGRLAASPPDQVAWNEFVDRYGPRIIGWCCAWRLQDADILDVSQAVLTKLSVQLKRFEYDPDGSFRRWLGRSSNGRSSTCWRRTTKTRCKRGIHRPSR